MHNKKMAGIYLFNLLTSKKAILRQFDPSNHPGGDLVCVKMKDPYYRYISFSPLFRKDWKNQKELKEKLALLSLGGEVHTAFLGVPVFIYSFKPWCPTVLNMRKLPFLKDAVIGDRMPMLRLLDRKPGLADITRDTSRRKSFRLRDAILYSYILDMRFILLLCLSLGFSIWWALAPEPLTLKPIVLCSPNMSVLYHSIIDTFYTKVCISHPNISLPCECGSPMNNETKILFDEPKFDPLLIDKGNPTKIKALAIYFGYILLVLAISETVSHHGVYLNLD